MGFQIGFEARLYYLSVGTRDYWGSSVQGDLEASGEAPDNLTEIETVQDLDLKLDPNEWDASSRQGRGFDASEPTTHKPEITFSIIYDTDDAAFQALKTAWIDRTVIAIACLDDESDVEGAEGLWADMKVMAFSRAEKLKEGLVVKVTLKPCYSATHPQWVTVAAASA
jgi:hypothetical protein